MNSAAIANAGTLAFNRSDNITVANVISGAGTVEKKGAGIMTLSQSQPTLTGPVVVSAGTLRPGNSSSGLGTVAGGTTVASGATLDVNGQTMGNETITVSGSGVGGAGAVFNSGGARQDATRAVILAGDTTFGGINRWDIRASGTPSGLTGNGYNLTKVGANEVWLVGLGETTLGNITINQGVLGIESTTTMGNVGATLTVNPGAALGFYGNNNAAAPLNKVMIMNSANWVNGNGDNYFSGPITLNGPNTMNVGATLRLLGPIGGPGSLVKDAGGTLALHGNNTFSGNVIANAGTLIVSNSAALGANKAVYVNSTSGGSGISGTRLTLAGAITTPSDVWASFYSSTVGDIRSSLFSQAGTNEWAGAINLFGVSGIVNFAADSPNALILSGPITNSAFAGTLFVRGTGAGTIRGTVNAPNATIAKTDASIWTISSSGNIWSNSQIAVGTIKLGAHNALCVSAPLLMGQSDASAAALDLNGFNQTLQSIIPIVGTGTRRIGNNSTTADSVFTFNGGANVSVFAGQFVDSLGAGSRKLALTVQSGTLTLAGANTYTGNTIVSGGTLTLNTSGTLASPLIDVQTGATLDVASKVPALTLISGQTLKGNGNVVGSITAGTGSTLSAGASIGAITITGALTTAAGGTNVFELDKSVPTNDLVTASSVVYGGTLVVNNLGPALVNGDSFKLFSAAAYSGSYAAIIPDKPGSGLAWDTSKLIVDGTLGVVVGIPSTPTNLTAEVSGNTLTLSWPADYTGWRLEAQTNSLNVGITGTWVTVPGSTDTNKMSFTIDPAQPTVFFRLGHTYTP